MELRVGDKVIYNFPSPIDSLKNKFIGTIEILGDTHIYLRNDEGIKLKVSYKNFDLLEPFELIEETELVPASENFVG